MARAKASHWQPRGDELMDVSALYSDALMRTIVGLIGDFDDDRRLLIGHRIQNVTGWLNARLHSEQAPTGPEINAALAPIAKKLKDLRAAIAALDRRSLAAVRTAAEAAPFDLQTEPFGIATGGDTRLETAVEQLAQLECWIAEAACQPGGKRGQKDHEPFKEAAFYLTEIWKRAVLHNPSRRPKPTTRELTELLKQSTQPVVAQYGIAPDLTVSAKEVLVYRWRPPEPLMLPRILNSRWPNLD